MSCSVVSVGEDEVVCGGEESDLWMSELYAI